MIVIPTFIYTIHQSDLGLDIENALEIAFEFIEKTEKYSARSYLRTHTAGSVSGR